MWKLIVILVIKITLGLRPTRQAFWYQPEQIHLSYGASPYEIVVTWSTFDKTPNSTVEFGLGKMTTNATGSSKRFVDGGREKRTQYIHKVKLSNLQANSFYGT